MFFQFRFRFRPKVKNILSVIHWIPSPLPSVKVQIKQSIAEYCQQTFVNNKFVDITWQCFASLPEVNFSTNNLNFHWRWWDWIQDIFLKFFSTLHYYRRYSILIRDFLYCVFCSYFWTFHGSIGFYLTSKHEQIKTI